MVDDDQRYAHARQIIKLALRRGARGTGSSYSFLASRTAVQPVPPIPVIGIPWVLIGTLATRAYMPERITAEVAIMIHYRDQAHANTMFISAGYKQVGSPSSDGFRVQHGYEVAVDVTTNDAPWLNEALAQPSRDVAGYPIMPRPYLMLLLLQGGRTQDWVDVQRMLRDTSPEERMVIQSLLEAYSPALVVDFGNLVTLAKWEFGT